MPVNDRPDIDRWILSDLQLLIRKARESFESFNVMAFCLEAERSSMTDLSNWYIRRNRRRFWKSEKGKDKQAAYQTLYTVLDNADAADRPGHAVPERGDVAKSASGRTTPESVHLCDYPQADESLIDAQLSQDMEALLDLVTLGSAARNTVKIKVRQPLAEIEGATGRRRRSACAAYASAISSARS